MKKKLIPVVVLIMVLCQSCDPVVVIEIKNRSTDTVLIYSAMYNSIDSISTGFPHRLQFDKYGKIILFNDNGISYYTPPDSVITYGEIGNKRTIFRNRKGYFFIITLETAKNYTWDEIRKNRLYDTLIVTNEMLRKNDWRIDYYGSIRE